MSTAKTQLNDSMFFKGFTAGVLVGGVAAWLLAPCSGTHLRWWLWDTTRENTAKTLVTIRMIIPGNHPM